MRGKGLHTKVVVFSFIILTSKRITRSEEFIFLCLDEAKIEKQIPFLYLDGGELKKGNILYCDIKLKLGEFASFFFFFFSPSRARKFLILEEIDLLFFSFL